MKERKDSFETSISWSNGDTPLPGAQTLPTRKRLAFATGYA
jgi:hypothetical protein